MQTRRSKRKATPEAIPEADELQPTLLTASLLSVRAISTKATESSAPHLNRHALVQRLYDCTSQLPHSVPIACEADVLACFKDSPCTAVLPGDDPWETLVDPQLNRAIGFGKTPSEIATFIRRGPLGMDGFCRWIETCVSDLNIQPQLLELRLERVFKAMESL